MTKTREEKLAYQRGYNRAGSRYWSRMQRLFAIMDRYRARITNNTNGKCGTCERWQRGGEGCQWGYCRADFHSGIEPTAWIEIGNSRVDPPRARLTTNIEFGCRCWLPIPCRHLTGSE